MRLRYGWTPLAVLALAAFAAAVPQAPKKPESTAKKSETAFDFKARMQEVMSAWSTLDPSKVAPFYSKEPGNVYYDVAPMKYVGWDAYAKGVPEAFADYSSLKITVGKDAKTARHGNVAWGTATWHGDGVKKNGGKETFDGRWTVVWQKTGDDWLIVHEHVSVPMGPPPPPAPSAPSRPKKTPPPPPPPPKPKN
jgi:ketosteroid isomerase-like protein